MKDKICRQLSDYLDEIDIIDAHEHFFCEKDHNARYLSFYDFMTSYIQWDLYSAGMPGFMLWNYPGNEKEAIEYYRIIAPYWEHVKYGSYARPARLAWNKYFGSDSLNEDLVVKIGDKMNRENVPGHYDEVFEECHIRYIINQWDTNPYEDQRFLYGTPFDIETEERILAFCRENKDAVLTDYVVHLEETIQKEKAKGSCLVKFFSVEFMGEVFTEEQAKAAFDAAKRGQQPEKKCIDSLLMYLAEKRIELCGKYDMVAAIHTGVWTDINKMNPELIFGIVERHPDTMFDIYHLGMPYVRECAFLGKNYPNVYLNLCWSHSVSEQMTIQAMHELIDLVPQNKIIGFGGDLKTAPEHIWGQLQVAKENMALVFAERVYRGRMGMEDAKDLLRRWMYENAADLYKIEKR